MTAVLARLDGPPPIPDGLPEPWPEPAGRDDRHRSRRPARPPRQVAATLSADAAPVGLLAAANDTVQLAALSASALSTSALSPAGLPLDAGQTQALPAVGRAEPGPAPAAGPAPRAARTGQAPERRLAGCPGCSARSS